MERAELKNLIGLGLLILVIAYFGYGGFAAVGYPGVAGWRAEAARLLAERRQLEQTVQTAQAMVANLDKIKKEREALELQLKELSQRLPAERESAQVLRSVETLAGKAGLTVNQVRRRPLRTQELYTEIPMEVAVGGGYRDLVSFADELSHLDRLVALSEFQVVQRPPASGAAQAALATASAGAVRAQMVAVVFQALPDAAAAPAPAR